MVLRPRHFRAIELLATTDMKKKEVAAEVGVSPRTLGRWCKDLEFLEEARTRMDNQPFKLDGLRLEAARRMLLNLIDRFDRRFNSQEPVREITKMLALLVGQGCARLAPDPYPPETKPVEVREEQKPEPEDDGYGWEKPVEPMTPQQAAAIWAERERHEKVREDIYAGRYAAPSEEPEDNSPADARESVPPEDTPETLECVTSGAEGGYGTGLPGPSGTPPDAAGPHPDMTGHGSDTKRQKAT